MIYAMVERFGNTLTETFETVDEAMTFLNNSAENGQAIPLGWVDSETDKVKAHPDYRSWQNGLSEKENKLAVEEQIKSAYWSHADILARDKNN